MQEKLLPWAAIHAPDLFSVLFRSVFQHHQEEEGKSLPSTLQAPMVEGHTHHKPPCYETTLQVPMVGGYTASPYAGGLPHPKLQRSLDWTEMGPWFYSLIQRITAPGGQ